MSEIYTFIDNSVSQNRKSKNQDEIERIRAGVHNYRQPIPRLLINVVNQNGSSSLFCESKPP
jgi:hypothetical protein